MRFFRQYSVGPYILDVYCPEIKLAIELDGGQYNDPESKEYDTVRSEYLKAQGIDVLRFWNHEVLLHIESVLGIVEERVTLKSRGGVMRNPI
jgi:very-short-patch-repair endonuclease